MKLKTIKLVIPLLFAGAAAWAQGQPGDDPQNPPPPPQSDNGVPPQPGSGGGIQPNEPDRKSTRLNSSH